MIVASKSLLVLVTAVIFAIRYVDCFRSPSPMGNFGFPRTQLSSISSDEEISINPIVASVKVSKTVEVFGLVKEMEADGEKICSLCVGEPDFLPPKAVLEAAKDAVARGETKYTAVTGGLELRKAIADDLKRRKGLDYNPQTEIVVANGAKQAVYQGVLATSGPGDTVIIPSPYWPSYPEMASLVGAEPVIVETSPETGYLLTPEVLRRAMQQHPASTLLILCNPSNPTGGVYNKKQLEGLAAVLRDYPKVSILADEIYERLIYEGECLSFATLPGMFHRTMTINGFSKAYAMTGMRLGTSKSMHIWLMLGFFWVLI